jgi:uncharacterized membrane protein YedE/YeeE
MSQDQLGQLHWMVLAATGVVTLLFGALMHRTHFCTMGAITDAVVMGSFDRLRQWALALAVAILGFGCLSLAGLISPLQSVYSSPRIFWFSAAVGGMLFGWGMVWASGCGAKSLVRFGAGNLKSLLVLMAMGISALMTLKGILAIPRVYLFETLTWSPDQGNFVGQWVSDVLNVQLGQGFFFAALGSAVLVLAWTLKERAFLNLQNIGTGLSVGLVITFVWMISGVLGHGLEHPDTLEEFFIATSSRKMESISLTAPVALGLDALMYFSDGTKRLSIGMVSVVGICLGSLISAKLSGTFRLEGFVNRSDLVRHLLGGCLMGVGAVLAMGCSIGQGLSGLSTLNVASFIATAGILMGAYLALMHALRRTA